MQANLPKIGQFGHAFRRGVVRPASAAHVPGEAGEKMWRNITLFVGLPSLILSSVNCYLQKHDHPVRPEIIDYPYMKILNRPFPWGDGKHSLFHNPKTNYIPGIGYEE